MGTEEATVVSVPNRETEMPKGSEEVLELLDSDSEDSFWDGDQCSAISCSDGDFELEDLFGDHFNVLGARSEHYSKCRGAL